MGKEKNRSTGRSKEASWVGTRAINRAARRRLWAFNKKSTGYSWYDSMESLPLLFPLVKVGHDESGNLIYKRLDEIHEK